MKKAPFCCAIVLATLNTVLGLSGRHNGRGPSAAAAGLSFTQNRRRLQSDFGFNGTTTEEVCNSIIENFFKTGYPEKLQTNCTCKPNSVGGYSVFCIDGCEGCLSGACSRYSTEFELNEDLLVENFQSCEDFVPSSFNGVTVCFREDYTTSPSTFEYFVDGQVCTSAEFVECPSLNSTKQVLDHLVNCSNLGYGMDMNFCEEGTIEEPFGFVQATFSLEVDDYTTNCGATSGTMPTTLAPLALLASAVMVVGYFI